MNIISEWLRRQFKKLVHMRIMKGIKRGLISQDSLGQQCPLFPVQIGNRGNQCNEATGGEYRFVIVDRWSDEM